METGDPLRDCSESSTTKEKPSSDPTNTEPNEKSRDEEKKAGEPPDGSKAADEGSGEPARTKSQSPDAVCSICLGKLENKSFTDQCFHMFCFVCLLEWSKVQPVCPLCKQPFKSIIHNVRSNDDYDQYHIESNTASELMERTQRNQDRFRYRTTMTHQNWIERQLALQQRQLEMLQRPSMTTTRSMWSRHRQASTSAFRKRIYNMGMRVAEVRTACGRPLRQRDVSPSFFTRNPACVHRLVPWLNRELNVLLHNHEDNVQFVLELIMDLLKRFGIQSEEFSEHLRSFLGQRTEHFIHEFYTFCRSPYDMVAYDGYAVYGVENNRSEPQEISSPSSSDDSVIAVDVIASPGNPSASVNDSVIVLNSDDEEVIHIPSSSNTRAATAGGRLNPSDSLVESVRNFLSSVGHSSPPWTWETPLIHDVDWQAPGTSHTVMTLTGDSALDLSMPSTSQMLNPVDGVTFSSSQNARDGVEGESSAPVEGMMSPVSVKVEYDTVSSYGSELEIVGFEKPWDERSALDVSSADEDELQIILEAKKKQLKELKRTRSNSSNSSRGSRRKKKRKTKTITRSRSRHRSRSESTSYFKEYDRKRRNSRSRKRHKRSRSRHRANRSRSRSRYERSSRRSRSRSRHRRDRSDSSRRSRYNSRRKNRRRSRSMSRTSRISRSRRSHSRRKDRSRSKSKSHSRRRDRLRSRSRSYTRSRGSARSRSRSKTNKSRNSRSRRKRHKSRSVSVEYCALGKYDVPTKRRERDTDRPRSGKAPSYTYEWVHGNRGTDTRAHNRRSRSSSSDSSIVCISRKTGTSRRRNTSDSIEVVYESQRKSKKHKSDKDIVSRKQQKRVKRKSRSVSVESRKQVDRHKGHSRDRQFVSRREEREKTSCKKHPTGHKGGSKASSRDVHRNESSTSK